MKQQILLIDDSDNIHTLVKSLLAEEPVEIHSAFDAQYGLELAASLRPDLILLDVEMPDENGYEACRRLKADSDTASIPIIFLTALATTAEVVRGLNLGAVDYIAKPFKLSEMLSRVRAALRTSHIIRLLEEKALIDAVTGIGNRALFKDRFKAEVALRVKSGNPLSCIALDVDQFKFINDTYGQPFGDYVLHGIGVALTEVCRVEDVPCRIEGERFVVLSPYTGIEEALALAEKMRVAVENIPFTRDDKALAVTCTFGVAQALHPYDRSLPQRAEQALDRSKNGGFNRVVADATPVPKELAAA
jgi:diguanylate cyclase (GGDEF)-like protein